MPDPLFDLINQVVESKPKDAVDAPKGGASNGGTATTTSQHTFGSAYVVEVAWDEPIPAEMLAAAVSTDPGRPQGALECIGIYQTAGDQTDGTQAAGSGQATGTAPVAVRTFAVIGKVTS